VSCLPTDNSQGRGAGVDGAVWRRGSQTAAMAGAVLRKACRRRWMDVDGWMWSGGEWKGWVGELRLHATGLTGTRSGLRHLDGKGACAGRQPPPKAPVAPLEGSADGGLLCLEVLPRSGPVTCLPASPQAATPHGTGSMDCFQVPLQLDLGGAPLLPSPPDELAKDRQSDSIHPPTRGDTQQPP